MHYEYPIEQMAKSARTRFQLGFAKMTVYLLPELEDVVYEPSSQGLRMLGASESALRLPAEILREMHGDEVELGRPRVRLIRDTAVKEPVMSVRISLEPRYLDTVLDDLGRRAALLQEIDTEKFRCTVRAEARLAALLGYPQTLATMTNNTADLWMWLNRYEVVPPDHGGDAA